MICRVCKSNGTEKDYLFKCGNPQCGAAHWDKTQIKKLREKLEDKGFFQSFIEAAGLEHFKNGENFVYVLRLRGEANSVYVGRTGLHPYVRYLNHIRGYRAGKVTKSKATAIIPYEGPMSHQESVEREVTLADELRAQGFNVHGGH